MPYEYLLLRNAPVPVERCFNCGADPFEPFLRGEVQRCPRSLFSWPPFKLRPYCSLICRSCKHIVGHEMPPAMTSEVPEPRYPPPMARIAPASKPIKGLWE